MRPTPERPTPERLFVYGTLMPGAPAHDLLARHLSAWRPATVEGWLLALPEGWPTLIRPRAGAWPGPGPAPPWGPTPVHGMLGDLDPRRLPTSQARAALWARLDAYEDHDPRAPSRSLYLREVLEVIEVVDHHARRAAAALYHANPSLLPDLLARAAPLPDGRWRPPS